MLTTVGLMISSGAFFPYILEEFQESRASTAAIQSIFYGVGMGTGKILCCYFEHLCRTDLTHIKKEGEYDQVLPQSHAADQPTTT